MVPAHARQRHLCPCWTGGRHPRRGERHRRRGVAVSRRQPSGPTRFLGTGTGQEFLRAVFSLDPPVALARGRINLCRTRNLGTRRVRYRSCRSFGIPMVANQTGTQKISDPFQRSHRPGSPVCRSRFKFWARVWLDHGVPSGAERLARRPFVFFS